MVASFEHYYNNNGTLNIKSYEFLEKLSGSYVLFSNRNPKFRKVGERKPYLANNPHSGLGPFSSVEV